VSVVVGEPDKEVCENEMVGSVGPEVRRGLTVGCVRLKIQKYLLVRPCGSQGGLSGRGGPLGDETSGTHLDDEETDWGTSNGAAHRAAVHRDDGTDNPESPNYPQVHMKSYALA
jgi:hypothetical protein